MSKVLNLNDCFPEPTNGGSRGPLPKQRMFLNAALTNPNVKFVRYCGGIGSGKTMIGCVTVLAWAISHPGDYLISRQFMPELRDTTYKTFLEICPKELILEHKVADSTVKLRSNGGTSLIMFRGLEEWDKLRSLNLNGFYIDEANQVNEQAFMLLMGRLRGRSIRKGILTQNSGGRDWSWRWFSQQDHIKEDPVKRQFLNIKAPSIENTHLPEGYVQTMLDTWSEQRIQREIFADEDSFEGQIYTEFRRSTHVVKPFRIPDHWTRVVGADHGYRNATCWLWGAVDEDENLYVYREFYEKEWIVDEIVKGHKGFKKPGVLELQKGEKISCVYIDPSVRAKRGSRNGVVYSTWDEYIEALPEGFAMMGAQNDVHGGIDRVKRYLKQDVRTGKPRLYIFETCTNLLDEIVNYRYQELRSTQEGRRSEKEDPVKINDHACDALRYLIMSRPDPGVLEKEEIWKKVAYNSIQGSLIREIQAANDPTKASSKDPFDP